jgi:parallel beta-helix repeat protein
MSGIRIAGDENRIDGNTMSGNSIGPNLQASDNTVTRNVFITNDTSVTDGGTSNSAVYETDVAQAGPWDNIDR